MLRVRIYVPAECVWLCFIAQCRRCFKRSCDRVYITEHFISLFVFSDRDKSPYRPECCMSVLSSVFPESVAVSYYIAGIVVLTRKRRSKELDYRVFSVPKLFTRKKNRLFSTNTVASGNSRKGLRKKVNFALLVAARSELFTTVIKASYIAVAVKGFLFKGVV